MRHPFINGASLMQFVYTQRQKGPRAYIVFSQGRAVAVTNMAKEADLLIRKIKAQNGDAVKWRRSSREAAEVYAAWHNHERDTIEAAEAASRTARIAARRLSTRTLSLSMEQSS